MILELYALAGVWLILVLLISAQGAATPLAHGFAYGLGPRDEDKPRPVIAGRLDRTVRNHIESLALFLPILIALWALDASNALSGWGALTFLSGRLLFAGFYIGGVPVLRSVAFGVAGVGLAMMAAPVTQALLAL